MDATREPAAGITFLSAARVPPIRRCFVIHRLLRSLIGYWHNHPALSYLFSGIFVGPTSQAPRFDEARNDQVYEMEIAFQQIRKDSISPPWMVDRIFRDLLIDAAGSTHRAEFSIDKLYPPDSASARLGLLEMRAFEMPPHSRMSLTQHLLLRSLVAKFWKTSLPGGAGPLAHGNSRPLHAAHFSCTWTLKTSLAI